MSNQIIDCVFYHDNKTSLKKRIEKYSKVVDKFVIFYKSEVDVELLTGTTKPIELVLVESELYITQLIDYVKKQELDFEDVISISVTNEFYQEEKLEEIKKLLPFGPVLLEKYVFYNEPDPIQYKTQRGSLFFFFNHIKNDVFKTEDIWLGKQNFDGKTVNILDGGYQDL